MDISINVCDEDVWEATFGVSAESMPWYRDLTFISGDWETPGVVRVYMADPDNEDDDDKVRGGIYGITDVRQAWQDVINGKGSKDGHYYHCGGPVDSGSIEDSDSCAGDLVLQMLVFGEIIYA